MANIVFRGSSAGLNENTVFKNNPLLNSEIDGNFNGLNQDLANKAPLASPALTGTPVAPTAAAGTNTTQLATTAFVNAERSNFTTLTNKTLLLQTPVDFPITSGSADGTKLTLNVTGTINTGAINVGDTVTITNTTNYNGTFIVTDVVDADTFKVASNIASGTVMGGSSQTVSKYNTDGSIAWDSSNDRLTVGTGTARKTLVDTDSTQALTNKTVNKLTITAPTTSATLTIANGKTLTVNNTVTLSGTDASTLTFGAGGTIAYTGGNLSQFAATTSAQLAGVISDETGSGALVFASEPTITKPNFNDWITTPVVYGSDVASGSLTLTSTENATKGDVILGGAGDTVKLNTTTAGFVKTNNTGVFSIDTNSYYYDGGTDVKVGDGGTGLSSAPTNGQLLIGNGTGYTLSTITAGTGTSVTNAAGSITIANTDRGSSQNIFKNMTDGINIAAADSNSDTFTFAQGGGLTVSVDATNDKVTYSHEDTSLQESVNNIGNDFIQSITVDDFGHITEISSASVIIGNGTLTLNTSGSGISSAQTLFSANQSSAATFTVTSNATSANTASTIVFRDGNGDFSARIINATDFNSTSDARLKGNISSFSGLDIINTMNPVQFNWKDSGKKSYGLLAQEIENSLPELVNEREDGLKGVSYIPIIAMLIGAVKELNEKIKELETK